MAEVGNAATGGVLVAPGTGTGTSTPTRTDGGGQKATGAGGGPSTVGNKEKQTSQRQLTYHGSPETLSDGTEVQRATNAAGNNIREERMMDGKVHTTETTPAGEVVSETWADPNGTSKTVDTHSDTESTTTRTFSDGHKEVTHSSPEGEHTQIYDRSGKNIVRTVSTAPDGQMQASNLASPDVTEWNPDASPKMYGDPIDPAHTLRPNPPLLARSESWPDALTAMQPAPRPGLGGGMDQIDVPPEPPAAGRSPRPPAGGGLSQIDMGDMEPDTFEGPEGPTPPDPFGP